MAIHVPLTAILIQSPYKQASSSVLAMTIEKSIYGYNFQERNNNGR